MPVEASTSAAPHASEPLCGVTLEQYAGIAAALDDALPLDALLANEGIAPAVWLDAEAAWKERLVMDGPLGSVFAAFLDKRAEAEDWIGRSVAPLDNDLAAWLSFLHASSVHPAPFELLASAGLRMNDLARLQRRWARRMADPTVQKQAADLVKKGARPLPPIHAGAVELKPFPWSKGGGMSPGPANPVARVVGAEVGEMTLDRYAAIATEIAERSSNEAHVLAKYGLSPPLFVKLDAAWKECLRADIELERDYHRLVEHNRGRIRSSAERQERAHGAEIPAAAASPREVAIPALAHDLPQIQAAPAELVSTSLLLEIPRGPALPFVKGAPAPEIAKSSPAETVVARARPELGGTAPAMDVPRGPALPFLGAVAPPVAAGPAKLGGTSLAVETPRGPVPPIVEGAAVQRVLANNPATPFIMAEGGTTAGSSSPALTPRPPGGETEDISAAVQRVLANKPATPFAAASVGETAQPSALAFTPHLPDGETEDISAAVARALPRRPATPFADGSSAAAPSALAPPPAERAKPSASAASKVDSETIDISAAVAQVLARRAAMPFGGAAPPAPASVEPTKAPAAPPSAASVLAPPAARADDTGSTTADISSVVQQVLAAARSAVPFSSNAATSESAAPPHHRQQPMIQGDAAPSLLSAPAAAPTTASPPATGPIQTPSPPAPRFPVTPRAPAPAPFAAGPPLPPLPPHLSNLSVEQYADLWIQLWMDPARAAEILVRWGIRDASSWAALQWLWQHRISGDPALSRRWTHVIAQLKSARGIR